MATKTINAAANWGLGTGGAVLVVDPSHPGDDTTNTSTPFTTVQSAVNAAASGASILIAPGTYSETVTVTDKNLTLQALTRSANEGLAGGVTLGPENYGVAINRINIVSSSGHYVILDGIRVPGSSGISADINVTGNDTAADLLAVDCVFEDEVTFTDGSGDTNASARLLLRDSEIRAGTTVPELVNLGRGVSPSLCEGYLSLSSTVAYVQTSQTAKTQIYLLPSDKGHRVSLSDDTQGIFWREYTITSPSIKTTDTQTGSTTNTSTTVTGLDTDQLVVGMKVTGTNIPANTTIATIPTTSSITLNNAATGTGSVSLTFKCPANAQYDLFLDAITGVPRLTFSAAWTNATTRSTAIDTSLGFGIKDGDARYKRVGAILITATDGEVATSFGGDATAGFWSIWNQFNRVEVGFSVWDSANSWTHANNSTWAAPNGGSTNYRATFMVGEGLEQFKARFLLQVTTPASTAGAPGIGVDSTSARSGYNTYNPQSATQTQHAWWKGQLAAGSHFISALDYSSGGTATFYGDNNVAYLQTGLHIEGWF